MFNYQFERFKLRKVSMQSFITLYALNSKPVRTMEKMALIFLNFSIH